MTDELKDLLIDKAQKLGWYVDFDEWQDWILETPTPAEEDFWFLVRKNNVVQDIFEFYNDFDAEEYVSTWLEAKADGLEGVPSVEMLVENTEIIKKKVKALYDALSEIEQQYHQSA